MNIYPHSSPLILTEAIYASYGGQSGSATQAQLQNSFMIAEQRVTQFVGTFLLPTIVTGTFPYNNNQFISTDYGYVHRVLSAKVLSLNNLQTCTLNTDTGCAYIFDDTYAYLNISCVVTKCNCNAWLYPYQFQVAYEAGLPTGTANQAPFEHALTIVAELSLNEMIYPRANEGAGDVGIEMWSSQGYSEKRKTLKRTALGESPRANYAAKLIENCVKRARKSVMLR